jgi:hypothetical protein
MTAICLPTTKEFQQPQNEGAESGAVGLPSVEGIACGRGTMGFAVDLRWVSNRGVFRRWKKLSGAVPT